MITEGRFWWLKNRTSKSDKLFFTCPQRESSYLLTLGRPAHGGPLSGGYPHVMAAFGQSNRLVYSITRNGRVQVVAKETAGGGSHLLRRGVTVPPVFIAVVSNRRTGPLCNETHFNTHVFFFFNTFKQVQKTVNTSGSLESSWCVDFYHKISHKAPLLCCRYTVLRSFCH